MKKTILLILALLSITIAGAQKREMRGAWIQCVNGQFQGLGTARMQQTLTYQLDELKKDGVSFRSVLNVTHYMRVNWNLGAVS